MTPGKARIMRLGVLTETSGEIEFELATTNQGPVRLTIECDAKAVEHLGKCGMLGRHMVLALVPLPESER